MEEKIQEVEQYFRNKLISGDYVVESVDAYIWSVLVDNKYIFHLWVANGEPHCEINNTLNKSYMYLKLSVDDRRKLWDNLNPLMVEYNETTVLDEKRKQFEALKIELNIE